MLKRFTAVQVAVILSVFYVAFQIFADIMALRIITVAGLTMAGGTLVYPLTFTLRDAVHKMSGANTARLIIALSAILNFVMVLAFAVVAALPAAERVGPQLTFGEVLLPVWRITIASVVAELVAELLDTEIYKLWVKRFGERLQWGRVVSSNLISVPVDSLLFAFIAYAGLRPLDVVLSIAFGIMLLKITISYLAIPLIYMVRDQHLPDPAAA